MPQRLFLSPRDALIWRILQIIGVVFLLIGLQDIASSWLPHRLGDPEWELGTTSNFFDVVPLLGLGVAFLLAAAVATGRRWTIRVTVTGAPPAERHRGLVTLVAEGPDQPIDCAAVDGRRAF